ncbi:hypothetical protein ACFX2A_012922 [Malus domestica]
MGSAPEGARLGLARLGLGPMWAGMMRLGHMVLGSALEHIGLALALGSLNLGWLPCGTSLGLLLLGGMLTVGSGLAKVAAIVAVMVAATVVLRGGGAAPLVVALSLVDRHGPSPLM